MLGSIGKGTLDILIYSIDWSAWLNVGDTLSTSTFTVPVGLTKVLESNTTTVSTVKVSGGTLNATYTITCTIVSTVSIETKTETFALRLTH